MSKQCQFVLQDYAIGEFDPQVLRYQEGTILDGLEHAPKGLQMILEGKNHGKMLVVVAEE